MPYALLDNFKRTTGPENEFAANILLAFPEEEIDIMKDIYKKLYILKKKKLIELSCCEILKPGEYISEGGGDIYNLCRIEGRITDKGMSKSYGSDYSGIGYAYL